MMLLAFYLVVLHFLGDFVLQTDWMATNKSKRWDALLFHVHVYCAVILLGLWVVAGYQMAFALASITFVAHFATDAVTSRINSRLWFIELGEPYDTGRRNGVYFTKYHANVLDGKRHWFFVGIGADQVLHYGQLFLTAHLLGVS